MKKLGLVGAGLFIISSYAQAVDRIGDESGVKGFVFLGAVHSSVQSNLVATVGGFDVSDDIIYSLDRAADHYKMTSVVPAFNVSYTFADSRTQLFTGIEIEDFLTQDSAVGFGVRQGVGSLGNVRASLLASVPYKMWRDPYAINVDRQSTERSGSGVRLGWEHIFESDFDLTLTTRKIELEEEQSGEFLGLTLPQRQLLDREGTANKLELAYRWIASPNHVFLPSIAWLDYDLDGDAMATDGYTANFSYLYLGLDNIELLVNVLAGKMESDTFNPVFTKKEEIDRLGASITMTYVEPFGMKNWRARAVLSGGGNDSNINFYDNSLSAFSVGALYNF